MADRELYQFVEPQPSWASWADAVNAGLFNCPDAGGWLKQLPAGALLIEDGFDAGVDRMVEVEWAATRGRNRLWMERLLRAALNEGEEE